MKSTSLSINKWVIILICVIIESTQLLQKQSYNICRRFVQFSIQPVPNLPVELPPLDLWEAHDVDSSPGQVIRTSASYEEIWRYSTGCPKKNEDRVFWRYLLKEKGYDKK